VLFKYNWNDEVKEDEMDRACGMQGGKRNAYSILVGNLDGKRPLGRPGPRWIIVLKWILDRMGAVWAGLMWLRIGTRRRLL
jgi:hypothetical protein